MSLLLKVVAEGRDPVMGSFELRLSDMAEQDRRRVSNEITPRDLRGTIESVPRVLKPSSIGFFVRHA